MVQYSTVVKWDPEMADVCFADADNKGLAGLAVSGLKITTGAPSAVVGQWLPGAIVKNIVSGVVYRNSSTTSTPTWTPLSGGGGGTTFTGTPATITPTAALATNPVFTGSALGTHQHDAISAGTPAGTISIANSTPLGSTGITAAGQDMTTTGITFNALVNEYAGCWLYSTSTPATPPVLITSNTAAVSQAIVFTVAGVAFTEVGNWSIARPAGTFTGSALATHQHAAITAGTPAGTNTSPAITVTGAAYTPAGTIT